MNPSLLKLEVLPNIGIDQISLGISRDEVREIMNFKFKEFNKTEDLNNSTDAYLDNSFQIFYDSNNKVDFIEVSYNPKSFNLVYKDINLFETEAKSLVEILSKETSYINNHPEIPYGYLFKEYKLILWRPRIETDYTEHETQDELRKGKYFMVIGIGSEKYLLNQNAN